MENLLQLSCFKYFLIITLRELWPDDHCVVFLLCIKLDSLLCSAKWNLLWEDLKRGKDRPSDLWLKIITTTWNYAGIRYHSRLISMTSLISHRPKNITSKWSRVHQIFTAENELQGKRWLKASKIIRSYISERDLNLFQCLMFRRKHWWEMLENPYENQFCTKLPSLEHLSSVCLH